MIVSTFQALACSVIELHNAPVSGFPDLLVGCSGVNHLVECKSPETRYGRQGLSASQLAFNRDWSGEKMWLCSSQDEAMALVQNWRKSLTEHRHSATNKSQDSVIPDQENHDEKDHEQG